MKTALKVICLLALLVWLGYEIYQLILAIKERKARNKSIKEEKADENASEDK